MLRALRRLFRRRILETVKVNWVDYAVCLLVPVIKSSFGVAP